MTCDKQITVGAVFGITVCLFAAAAVQADPCGMVPPIYQDQGPPIVRIGEQNTYVFFKDGVETFVIRPGFSGKVDEFGMLIPFPTPPAVRKVPDNIFPHIAAAIDPPEVVIDLRPRFKASRRGQMILGAGVESDALMVEHKQKVRVLREEAVGMYEVAVLEAGSAAALKRWMDQHGYRYPEGMDAACEDYVQDGWCFVAVKTKVGAKQDVDPRPGQRTVQPQLPAGSTFDGHVQAMGFRFRTKQLVVPMRLSTFNDGHLRNIVYLLTDGPRKIRSIPEEYVVRQVPGKKLFFNVTSPLPLRIIGGTERDLQEWHKRGLAERRNPAPKNGAARQLFAADMLAVSSGRLSLDHEEDEKELLAIGEHFGLRGGDIDRLNAEALSAQAEETVSRSLGDLKRATLTVVDGDFPREVLAGQNLTFAEYRMPGRRNVPAVYDAKNKGPAPKVDGYLKIGALGVRPPAVDAPGIDRRLHGRPWLAAALSAALVGLLLLRTRRTWFEKHKEQ